MSGRPSWAFSEPSANCTSECTMLCGCTTTSICSLLRPNSHLASITSRPLFMSEAESMVILAPMSQLGCFRAWALVTASICWAERPRNGPPEAVRMIFSMGFCSSPTRHWKMAECSESTGSRRTLCCLTRLVISSPATTRVSLLARAMSLPALMAATVGSSPA